MKKILIPLTQHATLGTTDEANGTYAPELTHALDVFNKAGIDYELASISGGSVPLYGTDMQDDAVNTAILANENFQARIKTTTAVADINANDFDAIFYPGGYGLLTDLVDNADFASIAAAHYEQGGTVAAVCHGPAALLPITLSSGEKLIASKSVTGFTREEEIDYDTINKIPFLLEESLTRSAARFNKVQPWQAFVIEDDRVITGQNPGSAHDVANAIVKQLSL